MKLLVLEKHIDENTKLIENNISLKLDYGILLYDVMLNKNKMHFLAKKMKKDGNDVLVHYTFK